MLYRLLDVPGNPIVELIEDVSHHPRHTGLVRQVPSPLCDSYDFRSPMIPEPEKWEQGGQHLKYQPWHCWLLENGHAIYDWYAVKIVGDAQGQEIVDYKARPTPLTYIASSPLIDQQREYIEPFFEYHIGRVATVGDPVVPLPAGTRETLTACWTEAKNALNEAIQRIEEQEEWEEDGLDVYRVQPPKLNKPIPADPKTASLKLGWIDPKGNFYPVLYEMHDEWEYQVLREKHFGEFQHGLRNASWIVLSANHLIKGEKSLTQRQLDTLFDLGVTQKNLDWYEAKLLN